VHCRYVYTLTHHKSFILKRVVEKLYPNMAIITKNKRERYAIVYTSV